jgi:hypothetical protein
MIRLSSSSLFYAPGMVRWIQNISSSDFNDEVRGKALRHYMLSSMYPQATGETIQKVLDGKFTVDGDDVVVDEGGTE